MPPLDLSRVACIPPDLLEQLEALVPVGPSQDWRDCLAANPALRRLAGELESYLQRSRLLAHHCTREPHPRHFQQQGLRPLTLSAHQDAFLRDHGDQFTAAEQAELRSRWAGYFGHQQQKVRAGRLWFCLTPETVTSPGTEDFFRFFGGEALHKPLDKASPLARKLGLIGQPAVVTVAVPGEALTVFSDYPEAPLAILPLRAWFRERRGDTASLKAEGYLEQAVSPGDVLRVASPGDFGRDPDGTLPA